ncbi:MULTISPECIES: IS30 family transposase [unclassified Streptococcus]|uniref:IS30 family transposase n=1 Tax=unclassified Streptococcus TaxID=2608887 RepID=UPI001072821A|nr:MULTISPECIES: IS30 family transposase [unclassified Streptococcus]MBF0806811.1 IS30 family transposase [Streptococcus sp. 19428wA2_WM07]TFU25483.1 IS30 family transposase [Streptococcus sp. WM07]
MQDNYTTKGKHLTINDRRNIERWLKQGKSNREIARLLGKAPQTINNEVKRGLVLQQVKKGLYKKVYSADFAQANYKKNRKRSVKKLILTEELKERILHYHHQKYSPEMMVRTKNIKASVTTIYYWINNGHLQLTKEDMLYPRRRKASRKQTNSTFKPAGKSIDERPKEINLRMEIGHYEIDTVILTKEKNNCLLVMTDRRSRYQIMRLIPDKTAQSVNQALKQILNEYQILSITADNGTEFNRLSEVFSEEHIYYAHPYSSWERGTNENQNRLIRRWLPKGTKETTPKEVAFIENWINNYPKKCLGYKSPKEFLSGG